MVAINVVNTASSGMAHPAHRPRLNFFIYTLSLMAVIGGFLFGYDTGIVSSAMIFVPRSPDLRPINYFWKELIVSITPGMAGVSALMAGSFSDKYGRQRMIVVSSFIFVVGALICSIGLSKYVLLFGRILLGVAIGIASMIVPIYVGEASPAHIRGSLVTGFQLMITFGLFASNVIAGGFSYLSPDTIGWRLMFGFAAMPALIQFIGFMFLPESPRWLYSNRGRKEAEEVLNKIYNGDTAWIAYELEEIQVAHEQQLREVQIYGDGNVLYRILTTPPVRRALFVGCALQAFQQISGINTIMYYTSAIIKSAGVRDDHATIWISAGTSSVNFLCTFVPMILVERLGRRKLLFSSVLGVTLSLLLMSGAFYLINNDSAAVMHPLVGVNPTGIDPSVENFAECSEYSNCDFCVTREHCGFCGFTNATTGASVGYCYPVNPTVPDDRSETGQCSGAPASANSSTIFEVEGVRYEWAEAICHSRYTILPIILMVVYLCAFSIGYAPMPWVLNAEFYPLWARSTCVSITTFVNWLFNLIIAMSFLTLTEVATKHGAFLIYAVVTALALIYFVIYVPETKGLELDEIQLLFMTKQERQVIQKDLHGKHNLTPSDISVAK